MRSIRTALTAAMLLGLGLGACAGSNRSTNACLTRCDGLEALERSTCELNCTQLGKTNAPPPGSAPATSQPGPTELPPTPTSVPGQAVDNGPGVAKPTAASTTAPPVKPSAPLQPLIIPGPASAPVDTAALYRQRAACETSCDAESTGSDRATCRLQCAQITDRPASTAPRPGTSQPGTPQPTPTDPAAVARCQSGCNAAGGSETDRATCRLNCSANGTVIQNSTSSYVLHGKPPSGDGDRAAVIRSSGGAVNPPPAPAPTAPANQQRVAQCASQAATCTANCGTQLAPCNTGCDQAKLSATDRATCKLTCETNVDVCRDDCRIAEGKCRG
jgi:hypothetical protein